MTGGGTYSLNLQQKIHLLKKYGLQQYSRSVFYVYFTIMIIIIIHICFLKFYFKFY